MSATQAGHRPMSPPTAATSADKFCSLGRLPLQRDAKIAEGVQARLLHLIADLRARTTGPDGELDVGPVLERAASDPSGEKSLLERALKRRPARINEPGAPRARPDKTIPDLPARSGSETQPSHPCRRSAQCDRADRRGRHRA